MTMAAVGNENRLGLARFAAFQRLVDRYLDCVACFRGTDKSLAAGELYGCFEHRYLFDSLRLDNAVLIKMGNYWGHAVISQPAGVYRRRYEAVTQSVH